MQTIYLDISNKGVVHTIYAKQGDVGRKFEVVFTDSGIPYSIPTNAKISIWYEGDSGVGNYTDIGENSAIAIGENKAVVELITQMLSEDGEGIVCLVMNAGNNQIGSWNIRYLCERVPGFDSEGAKEYYTAFSKTVESLKQVTENLTPEAIGAAPAGFGLGEGDGNTLTTLAQLDAVKVNSFHNYYGEALPVDDAHYSNVSQGGLLTIYGQGFVTQYFFLRYPSRGSVLKRYTTTDGSVWEPWEWVNPPMIPGVEYRTTERWNGKAVYTKLVNCGNPGKGETAIPHNTPMTNMLRYAGTMDGQWALPNPTTDGHTGNNTMWCKADKNNIWTFMGASIPTEECTLYVTLWYTKD